MKKWDRKKILLFLLLTELIVLCAVGGYGLYKHHNKKTVDFDLSSLVSGYISYDNGWNVAESDIDCGGEEITLIVGPWVHIDKGSYTVYIWYDAVEKQKVELFTGANKDVYLDSETITLSSNKNFVKSDFKMREPVDDLEFYIYYNGYGDYHIYDIKIEENLNGVKQTFVWLVLLFALLDTALVRYEWVKSNLTTVMLLTGVGIVTLIPVGTLGSVAGHDYYYHMARLEGLVEELKLGVFPARIDSFIFDGAGYPNSIYYNDLFLYFPAVLRFLGFTVTQAYEAYLVAVNIIAIFVAYFCFGKMFKDNRIALLTTLAYITSSYRLVDIYVRSSVGEYTAMLFMPFIALALWQMYVETDEYKTREACLYIIVGMSGMIGSHMLTTEMVVTVMILVVAYQFKKTFAIKQLKTWMVAVAGTVLLNLYFIVPFLDYFINVDVNVNHVIARIQTKGTCFADYFGFFRDPVSTNSVHVNKDMQLNPGLLLTLVFFLAIVFLIKKKMCKEGKALWGLSVIIVILTTRYFPWDSLALGSSVGNMLAQIQFPWRYLGILILILAILLGVELRDGEQLFSEVLKLDSTAINYWVIGLSLGMALLFSNQILDNVNRDHTLDVGGVSTYSVGAREYVRVGTDKELITNSYTKDGLVEFNVVSKIGSKLTLECQTGELPGHIEVPFVNYKGYKAFDDIQTFDIYDGENNMVAFDIPSKYQGTVRVEFVEPVYWKAAMLISGITLFFLGAYYLFLTKKEV